MYIYVLCLIVVPLSPCKTPFAVQIIVITIIIIIIYESTKEPTIRDVGTIQINPTLNQITNPSHLQFQSQLSANNAV
jgi:hypothetical protein